MGDDARKFQVRLVGHDARRQYAYALRERLVAACLQPGASATRLAFGHGVNANLLPKWMAHEGDHSSRWTACQSISAKIGCSAHTLLDWVKKAEVAVGKSAGVPTDVFERMKALERENRELRQANEILRKASAYFAQAELDRPFKR